MNWKRTWRKTRYIVYRETMLDRRDLFVSFLGALLGISLIGWLNEQLEETDRLFLIGSFGASAILVYGAAHSPLAQPRNLFLGHLLSAFVGVSIARFLQGPVWLEAGLAVSLSLAAMQATRSIHPPGGATGLIAIIGSEKIQQLGYEYVVSPVLWGVLVLFFIALIVNNLTPGRRYPYPKGLRYFRRDPGHTTPPSVPSQMPRVHP